MTKLDDAVTGAVAILGAHAKFRGSAPDIAVSVREAFDDHRGNFRADSAVTMTSTGAPIQPVPTGYVDRFSRIRRVEVSRLEDGHGENFLPEKAWEVVRRPGGPAVFFKYRSEPASGAEITYHLEVPHDDEGESMAFHEVTALKFYGAAFHARKIAAKVTQTLQPAIGDSVDFGTAPDSWRRLADDWEETYRSIMGQGPHSSKGDPTKTPRPSTAVGRTNWDVPNLNRRVPFIFHRQVDR